LINVLQTPAGWGLQDIDQGVVFSARPCSLFRIPGSGGAG
jgi:hypothetical protein